MCEKPLVTVVTLAYNHEKYLRACLEGILMQKTNFPFELIIHEDASLDKTAEIIQEYEAKYPHILKPIYQKQNQYSQGVNIGNTFIYPKAKGKYIALCEGDDYWTDPYKLQKQVDFLEEHPDFSMCFHNGKMVWEKGEKSDKLYAKIKEGVYKPAHLYRRHLVVTASIVARIDVVRDTKYIETLKTQKVMYGDLFFILSCTRLGKIWGMPDVMSVYRRHEGGVVYKQGLSDCAKEIDLAYFFLSYFEDPDLLDMIRKMCFWDSFSNYLHSSIHGYKKEQKVFKAALKSCFRWRYTYRLPLLLYKVMTHWNKFKK